MKRRVLITCPQLQSTIEHYRHIFQEHNIDIELPVVNQQLSESELLEIIEGFDGVIAGDDDFTARVLQKGQKLRVIARWGVGVDGVDLDAAKRLGIRVSNTPGVFADEVADVVMGYIILLARQLHKLDQAVREGTWAKYPGISLRGKTLGVIGMGSIGLEVASRGKACGMQVMGNDVVPVPESVIRDSGINQVELDELLSNSDFVTLNCNLTDSNRHMLGTRQFKTMKPGTYLINAARGALIDEAALIRALADGIVAGAALDVFEVEPLPAESPLRRFESCIFGTHNSSNTREAVNRVNDLAISNLLNGLGNGTD